MAQIRCIRNVKLEVVKDGVVSDRNFYYGEIYRAKRWETIDNDYINIELADGTRIEGILTAMFENFGTPMFQSTETPLQEAESLPKDDDDDDNDIMMEGTILGDDQ